jgi:Lon protease-like protein
MALPLHIFEPRYRDMVRDALATDKVIALAQPTPESDPRDPRPPLRPIACAALISWDEQLSDGRSNIVVQGLGRVRLLSELPDRQLYREFRAEPLEDPPYSGPEEDELRQAVFELSGELPSEVAQSVLEAAVRGHGGGLADVISAAVVPDLERRQRLLEELDVRVRLKAVLGEVSDVLARLGGAAPKGPLN